ncbi:hypothetical protein Hypma_000394 [Hypsizygus marmoreus]|uniref:Extracellular membrane protein CFEM domain-containing protein n=1 Tax=Hypsizygus marmoreus TaxID=39966 RepID=A0A369J961_HYPMA|nr:hypothetical protein Hypma_000394 [Hypsizygus marmoreus]
MVAFVTLLSATATLFLACTNVVANPTPDSGIPALLARRGTVDTSKFSEACKSSCEPFANIFVNPSCDDTCQCKDASIDLAGACYSCAAAQKADYDIKGAQGVIDGTCLFLRVEYTLLTP